MRRRSSNSDFTGTVAWRRDHLAAHIPFDDRDDAVRHGDVPTHHGVRTKRERESERERLHLVPTRDAEVRQLDTRRRMAVPALEPAAVRCQPERVRDPAFDLVHRCPEVAVVAVDEVVGSVRPDHDAQSRRQHRRLAIVADERGDPARGQRRRTRHLRDLPMRPKPLLQDDLVAAVAQPQRVMRIAAGEEILLPDRQEIVVEFHRRARPAIVAQETVAVAVVGRKAEALESQRRLDHEVLGQARKDLVPLLGCLRRCAIAGPAARPIEDRDEFGNRKSRRPADGVEDGLVRGEAKVAADYVALVELDQFLAREDVLEQLVGERGVQEVVVLDLVRREVAPVETDETRERSPVTRVVDAHGAANRAQCVLGALELAHQVSRCPDRCSGVSRSRLPGVRVARARHVPCRLVPHQAGHDIPQCAADWRSPTCTRRAAAAKHNARRGSRALCLHGCLTMTYFRAG